MVEGWRRQDVVAARLAIGASSQSLARLQIVHRLHSEYRRSHDRLQGCVLGSRAPRVDGVGSSGWEEEELGPLWDERRGRTRI